MMMMMMIIIIIIKHPLRQCVFLRRLLIYFSTQDGKKLLRKTDVLCITGKLELAAAAVIAIVIVTV